MNELRRMIEAADRAAGPVFLATVVDVDGSAYRRPGARMLILERGVPVARLEPVSRENSSDGRLARLERSGLLRRASVDKRKAVIHTPPPALADGESALEALIGERRTGR